MIVKLNIHFCSNSEAYKDKKGTEFSMGEVLEMAKKNGHQIRKTENNGVENLMSYSLTEIK